MIVFTVLPSLAPLQRIDDCFEFRILTKNFVTCCYQVTNYSARGT